MKWDNKGREVNVEVALDKELAEEYNRIIQQVDSERVMYASDGTRVDLLGFANHLRNKIAHLPSAEREGIMVRFKEISKLKARLGWLKRKAFGTGENGNMSLLELRKAEVLEMFGMYYGPEEVHKKLVEESGLLVNVASIRRFQTKYRQEIERLQMDNEKEYDMVGVARKRSRLEQLDHVLRRLRQEMDGADGTKMLPFVRELIKVLEQARKEVEGEKVHMTVDGQIDINMTMESLKSVEDLYCDINFMAMLIARVAPRLRVNPLLLQYRLVNSWYAKHTGMRPNDSIMDEIPDYPSRIILNWDDLKAKAGQKEREEEQLGDRFSGAEVVDVAPEDKEMVDGYRGELRNLVKRRQNGMQETKDRVSGKKAPARGKRTASDALRELREKKGGGNKGK